MGEDFDFNGLMKDLRSYEEHVPFQYKHKCEMTVLKHSKDKTVFDNSKENVTKLVKEIVSNNPHYKLKFESDDFLCVECVRAFSYEYDEMYFSEAEMLAVKVIETVNSRRWTFEKGCVYCPYWQMEKDEYVMLADELYQEITNNIKNGR